MNKWERKRAKAIKEGCYSPIETKKIRLAISKKEIISEVKKEKYPYLLDEIKSYKEDIYFIIDDLKSSVYLKKVENKKKELIKELYNIEKEKSRQFPKLFWNEYVYEYDKDYTFSVIEKWDTYFDRTEALQKIYIYLLDHPEYHKYSGEKYQNSELEEKIFEVSGIRFSWRSWGALMAAFMNEKERKRKYHYMSFYMR